MKEKRIFPLGSPERQPDKRPRMAAIAKPLAVFQRFLGMHRLMAPVVTFVALLLFTLIGYLAFTHNDPRSSNSSIVVIVNHDDVEQTVPTAPTDVRGLLQKLNIRIGTGDVVEPALNTPIRQDDFRINVYRAKPVEVIDNGRKTFAFSAATTPRSVAKQAGASLYPEDALQTRPVTDFLRDGTLGTTVTIKRATPIILNLYGQPVQIRTQAETVGDLLKERKVKLGKDDSVQPVAETKLTPQTQVFLLRQGTKIASVTEDIPMPQQVIQDPNLAFGTSAVRQQGSAGQKVVTYQLMLQNGQEIGRTVIQEVVSKNPVQQIVVQGTSLSGVKGTMALAGISPSDYQYVDYIVSRESGWCPTKAQGQYGGCQPLTGAVPTYGGYGLCQSTPPQKMASAGADWQTNPVTQLKWCSGYAIGRYGSWQAAYNHWLSSHNW